MMRHVVVATCDPIGRAMAGPAIRAWNIAEQLASEHEVELVTLGDCDRSHDLMRVRHVGEGDLRELERWMDVLIFQGGLLRIHPLLAETPKPVVADVYDPFHLENLEPGSHASNDERTREIEHLNGVLNDQLLRADFFVCASERQRDFWMGSLASLGRVNPATYDRDPTLRSLIDVVPFGIPATPPKPGRGALRGVVSGIGHDDPLLIWGGGVYNWLDPLTLVRAVAELREQVPRIRLYFLGLRHPNPAIPAMRMANELRVLADDLGLVGRHVFFNDGWVDYDSRGDFLLEADIAVSTHLEHVETAYSFRTRILDYLWAGKPIVTTTGDEFAALVEREDLGAVVQPGDAAGLARSLRELLEDDARRAACGRRSATVGSRFQWGNVVEPLARYCLDPQRSPDARIADAAPEQSKPGVLRRFVNALPRDR